MLLLIIFALLAGIITILSPCILPILPIILSSSLTGSKKRPIGVVIGFIISFTFFTLFLTAIVKATGLSADSLRNISVVIIAVFGVALILPKFQVLMEQLFSKLAAIVPQNNQGASTRPDIIAGFFIGISLGLIWTPCVGPILASIITLAATSTVTADAILITFAYSIGTAIPLLGITYGGRQLLQKIPWLLTNTATIQKAFGVLMIATALAIYFQVDRKFQSYILNKFPNYGVGLTKFEDNPAIKKQLEHLKQKKSMNVFELPANVAPEFIPGGVWFNSQPLSIKDLRGKVVLVDFWTYTCINCIRTLPYIKSWYQKYKDKGLVVVGVHTPEFEFEKNPANVQKAIKDFGLEYPIMQDNNYATWNAYDNHYWPAKYFIDVAGTIRFTHFGEGEYDQSEQRIQALLKEGNLLTSEMPISNPQYTVSAKTPETYLGASKINNFASPERIAVDQLTNYSTPKTLSPNTFAFAGSWIVGNERAMPGQNSTLTFNFNAQEVFLVMRPKTGTTSRVRVFLDGNVTSIITIDTDKLYQVIKLTTPGEHLLRLEFLDGNVELYAFTFG